MWNTFIFPQKQDLTFMQIVAIGDGLHEISNPIFLENKKNTTSMSPAELAQRVVNRNPL